MPKFSEKKSAMLGRLTKQSKESRSSGSKKVQPKPAGKKGKVKLDMNKIVLRVAQGNKLAGVVLDAWLRTQPPMLRRLIRDKVKREKARLELEREKGKKRIEIKKAEEEMKMPAELLPVEKKLIKPVQGNVESNAGFFRKLKEATESGAELKISTLSGMRNTGVARHDLLKRKLESIFEHQGFADVPKKKLIEWLMLDDIQAKDSAKLAEKIRASNCYQKYKKLMRVFRFNSVLNYIVLAYPYIDFEVLYEASQIYWKNRIKLRHDIPLLQGYDNLASQEHRTQLLQNFEEQFLHKIFCNMEHVLPTAEERAKISSEKLSKRTENRANALVELIEQVRIGRKEERIDSERFEGREIGFLLPFTDNHLVKDLLVSLRIFTKIVPSIEKKSGQDFEKLVTERAEVYAKYPSSAETIQKLESELFRRTLHKNIGEYLRDFKALARQRVLR